MKTLLTLTVVLSLTLLSGAAAKPDVPSPGEICDATICSEGGVPLPECVATGSCKLPEPCVLGVTSCNADP